ncbi:hypothetical protein GYMLUDRAFT_154038 [Collybiopsis luxurians FD-317 M1]|nr:hypothetical protein GYMLUDRAFT_154038 [Collybiopsis luxurians FD-317 M1]
MPESDLNLSFYQLVQRCDNANLFGDDPPSVFDSEKLVPLYLSSQFPIGLLRPIIVEQLHTENERSQKENLKQLWDIDIEKSGSKGRVSLAKWADSPAKRTVAIKELCERWRDTGLFSNICGPKKWRSESYPVYKDPFGPHDYPENDQDSDELNFAFEMERSACALFGIVTYGVHMSIYHEVETDKTPEGREIKLWVPTRARTKQTWPGFLDNSVAGGTPSRMAIFESLVKECMEEASISAEIVRKHARSAGSISYFFRTSDGWLQPEVEYVYRIAIPQNADPDQFTPKPLDGEVESFELLDQEVVISKMREGRFKPNCALVIIDLLIGLGYITPDNEPDFMKIITRLHGRFDYNRW